VWPEGSDGTDINALMRSHNRRVIALADDFCKVHLFAYPCSRFKVGHSPCFLSPEPGNVSECVPMNHFLSLQAPSHKYSAHSSHVTNVSFLYSDSHLISTGGKDTSIMQWRLVKKSSLSLTDGIISKSAPRRADPVVPMPPSAAVAPIPEATLAASRNQETSEISPSAEVIPLTTELTPPQSESTPPPSDTTVSLKDSLETSDDTATPSDEGLPPLTPAS
ncbi:hypothetical protein XENOCAPTIV_017105, partial [Xenoophorus captivus]